MVSKPPPKRKVVKPITITMKVADDGLDAEIFLNHRLSEKDIDEASLLTLFVIFHFLFLKQVFRYFSCPFSCEAILLYLS